MKRESEALLPSLIRQLASNFSQLQTLVDTHPELENGDYYKKSVEFISESKEHVVSITQG